MWRRENYWQGSFGYPRLLIVNYLAQPAGIPCQFENTISLYSNAGLVQISEGQVYPRTGFITNTAYPSVVQCAVLSCLDVAGLVFSLRIPAPIRATVFLADGITVDPAVAAAVLAAATADQVCSPQGNMISSIVSGLLNGPAIPGSTLS